LSEENDIAKIFKDLSGDEAKQLITKVVQAYGKTLESCAQAGGGVYDESTGSKPGGDARPGSDPGSAKADGLLMVRIE